MDIFSHGLWTAVAAKGVNITTNRRTVSVGWTAFWGIFPDLFAFTIPFAVIFWNIATGAGNFSAFPMPSGVEPPVLSGTFLLASHLYNISHSLIVFAVVFSVVSFAAKKPIGMMLGWLFHILVDIPTHSYAFFPTPLFWPVSTWTFNGFSWASPYFLIPDYALLIVAMIILWRADRTRDTIRT